eukprot:66529_1
MPFVNHDCSHALWGCGEEVFEFYGTYAPYHTGDGQGFVDCVNHEESNRWMKVERKDSSDVYQCRFCMKYDDVKCFCGTYEACNPLTIVGIVFFTIGSCIHLIGICTLLRCKAGWIRDVVKGCYIFGFLCVVIGIILFFCYDANKLSGIITSCIAIILLLIQIIFWKCYALFPKSGTMSNINVNRVNHVENKKEEKNTDRVDLKISNNTKKNDLNDQDNVIGNNNKHSIKHGKNVKIKLSDSIYPHAAISDKSMSFVECVDSLKSMGFQMNDIARAIKIYQTQSECILYRNEYYIEPIIEIILQNVDKSEKKQSSQNDSQNIFQSTDVRGQRSTAAKQSNSKQFNSQLSSNELKQLYKELKYHYNKYITMQQLPPKKQQEIHQQLTYHYRQYTTKYKKYQQQQRLLQKYHDTVKRMPNSCKSEQQKNIVSFITEAEGLLMRQQDIMSFLRTKGLLKSDVLSAYNMYFQQQGLYVIKFNEQPKLLLASDCWGFNAIVSRQHNRNFCASLKLLVGSQVYSINGKIVEGLRHEYIAKEFRQQSTPFTIVFKENKKQSPLILRSNITNNIAQTHMHKHQDIQQPFIPIFLPKNIHYEQIHTVQERTERRYIETQLVSLGFQTYYINKAFEAWFEVYQKKYHYFYNKQVYNIKVITAIIVTLQLQNAEKTKKKQLGKQIINDQS